MNYEKLFAELHRELIPYYRYWTHDAPMVVSGKRDAELKRMAGLLMKAAFYYADHYEEYLGLIPYEEKVLEILSYVRRYPYKAGTWRPDYLILDDGRLMFCEITSRFFGNGYFLSYFMECTGEAFAKDYGITDRTSYFEELLAYFASMAEGKKRLVVLKSADKSDSIKLYVPFYQALGLETLIIEAPQAESSIGFLDSRNDLVVSALNQKDLLSFSPDTLKRMADLGTRNDFRSVFLLHDKRFFRMIFEDAFTKKIFTDEETAYLRAHTVETHLCDGSAVWEKARTCKDGFILKHHCLGKSEKVYAGCLTSEEDWQRLFDENAVSEMILQPFMSQRICRTRWQGKELDDYVAGTMLTVDDRYFGTGLFRTSTRPVINQTDAHKIAQLVTDQWEKLPGYYLL